MSIEVMAALKSQLATKSEDMDQLKQALDDCAELSKEVVSRIDELDQQRSRFVSQVAALRASTPASLEQWRLHDKAWEEVKSTLAGAFYCAEHSKPPVITLETLRSQVESLQVPLTKAHVQ
ncbi:UNVERIFIED_CONTAM: hypothetical protein K2H54_018525 [Gekko kuhli]